MQKIKALIWKEWRESRLFFLTLMGMVFASRLMIELLHHVIKGMDKNLWASIIANVIIPLFASFIATIPFCREFDQQSDIFLLSKPLSRIKIFVIKYITSFILMLFIVLTAQLLYQNIIPPVNDSGATYFIFRNYFLDLLNGDFLFYFMFLTFLTALYSSLIFSSILVRRVLASIVLAPFIILIFSPVLIVLCLTFLSVIISSPVAIFLLLSTLSIILIGTSGFLWIKYISRSASNGKILGRLALVVLILFLFSSIIYTYEWIVADIRFKSSIADAKKAGIIFDINKIMPPKIPDDKNAAIIYKKAFPYLKIIKEEKLKKSLYSSTIYKKNPLEPEMKKMLLTDPVFVKMFKLIDQASELHEANLDIDYKKISISMQLSSNMRFMSLLNYYRVNYYLELGRDDDALKALNSGFAMTYSLKNNPYLFVLGYYWTASVNNALNCLKKFPTQLISLQQYKKWMLDIDISDKQLMKNLTKNIYIYYIYRFKPLFDRTFYSDNNGYNLGKNEISRVLYLLYLSTPVIKKEAISFLDNSLKNLACFIFDEFYFTV